jgi:transposase
MRRLAKRDDIELWSLDECHFQQHGSRCRMWVAPEVRDPVLMHAPTRKSVACFGAVSLNTGRFVWRACPVFNAETFMSFLRQLLRHRRRCKRMVVVLDNAKYHHAILFKPLLRKYWRQLTLLFLPPYSPQLAPIERVWKLTRRLALHNRYFATLNEVLSAVEACFRHWVRPNGVLRRLCCII